MYLPRQYLLMGVSVSFDTYANALYTTDMHLETYLNAARNIVGRFIASRSQKPGTTTSEMKILDSLKKGNYEFKVSRGPAAGHVVGRLLMWQRNPKPGDITFIGTIGRKGADAFEVTGTTGKTQYIDFKIYIPENED